MCARYYIDEDGLPEVAFEFKATIPVFLQEALEFPTDGTEPTKMQWAAKLPRWNIAPKAIVPIIRWGDAGELELAMVTWSLTPRWAKELTKYSTHNAVGEELATKPSFRASLKDRRCLIPATGFYEWTGPTGNKTAYLVTPTDQPLFAFAGLWDRATIDGKDHDSCTIVTWSLSPFFQNFHHREAVVLPRESRALWMDKAIKDKDALTQLLGNYRRSIKGLATRGTFREIHVLNTSKSSDGRTARSCGRLRDLALNWCRQPTA